MACANALRRRGFSGTLTMLSADQDPPVDRPNLSKDYLAGAAPEEWMPLRPAEWYAANAIDLRLAAEAPEPLRRLLQHLPEHDEAHEHRDESQHACLCSRAGLDDQGQRLLTTAQRRAS